MSGRPPLSFDGKITALLRRIEFPPSFYGHKVRGSAAAADAGVASALALRSIPFSEWPTDAWLWFGHTTKRRPNKTRMQEANALTTWKGHTINPARLLYEFFSGEAPPPGNKFHHKLRNGGRAPANTPTTLLVDVNPANYVFARVWDEPGLRKYKLKPKPDTVLRLFVIDRGITTGIWPHSLDEMVEMFPNLIEGLAPEVLEATYNTIS